MVNLRFVIFSAGMAPHFSYLPMWRRALIGYFNGDVIYLLFIRQGFANGHVPGKEAYFWGMALVSWLSWQASSLAGIALASVVPDQWGLGLAGTLALIPIMVSAVANRSTLAAVAVAGIVALLAALAAGTLARYLHRTRRLATPARRGAAPQCARRERGRARRRGWRAMSDTALVWWTIAGMTVVTALTRALFLIGGERTMLPERAQRALRYAPAAALVAVVLPDVLETPAGISFSLANHDFYAAAAGLAWFLWRRSMIGTIVVGMLVSTALRLSI